MTLDRVPVKPPPPVWLYFLLFTVSGFSGLIYESIWSHYLKLFLGHAAYAQSLVLVIYMGGLAVGSWITARFAERWRTPILAYAVVEGLVGLFGLWFHAAFQSVTTAFYTDILPGLGGGPTGSLLMWLAASGLILPQTILLGMTFPLLAAGILRRYPANPGNTLGMLYFTNSIGAAVGVLASGFWLIGLIGLPGTIRTAGALNIILAVTVWMLATADPGMKSARPAPAGRGPGAGVDRRAASWLLIAAFVTGLASFIYEIGWIRMLSLVLGSATHAFELMLSAFISGLALGSLWIRKRIDAVGDPLRFAANVQVVMAVLAMLSVLAYGYSFPLMSALVRMAPHTDSGYGLFMLGSHAIAMAVMLPTTFVAGMTLPLFTHILLRNGAGEKAIGQIYAANTLGAIGGVLFAMHVALPVLGLKNTIGVGALVDLALGMALYLALAPRVRWRLMLGRGIPALAVITAAILQLDLQPGTLASGVYRYGEVGLPPGADIVFYRDGKTATVSVERNSAGMMTIATNGKTDASIQVAGTTPSPDEKTMAMLAGLALAYRPEARDVAVIGFGSGLTTHTLLASPSIASVDTIEIEPAMIDGARVFGARVRRAFDDPRSHVRVEDAKTFFAERQHTYDVIVSEPSNPWVSGVASLFTEEFYARTRDYLDADGILVQWIQYYEINDDIVYSILKALTPHFSDVAIYHFGQEDGAIVARKSGTLPDPDFDRLFASELGAELRRAGMADAAAARYARIGDSAWLAGRISGSAAPANSDYYPYVDREAARARFKKEHAGTFAR